MKLWVEGTATCNGDTFRVNANVSFPSIFGWNFSGINSRNLIPRLESQILDEYEFDSVSITSVKKIGGLFG